MSFDDWVSLYARKGTRNAHYFDNHTRPMTEIVPEGATIFKLEEGTKAVVDWLDKLAGDTGGARELPKSNETEKVILQPGKSWKRKIKRLIETKVPNLDERYCQKIYDIYRIDYDRFGYGAFDPLENLEG
ncbi:MAG: sulfotransferase family 2 domain-containing protein [Pseudomonadota bacterium]